MTGNVTNKSESSATDFPNLLRLDGKGALVTGAAKGIGKAVALALASCGAKVFAVDVNGEQLKSTMEELGSGHHSMEFDLRQTSRIPEICETAVSLLGTLDILAHVAGVIIRRASIDDVTEEDWDLQFDVNLKSTFFLNREAARIMSVIGKGGSIINFTSQGWWTGGYGGSVTYSATKGGVVSLTRGLSRTFANDGIRVNAVAPGAVDTDMMNVGFSDEDRAKFIDQIPLGRMANPDELASTVVFLASDASSFMTGTTLNVSGGQLIY